MSVGVQSSDILSGVEGGTFRMAYPHGWQVGTVYWQEVSVPCDTYFFKELLECPHGMAAGFPQSD